MSENVAGSVAFVVGIVIAVAMLFYCNTTVWHHEIAYAHNHPQKGWKVHYGKVINTEHPDFTQSPPEVPGKISFLDYYEHPQETSTVTFNKYPFTNGTRVEVDVSRDGSIYAPNTKELGMWENGWGGPRSADNTGLVMIQLLGLVLDVVGCSFLFLGLTGLPKMHVPRLRGRLGTR